jgi:hypothetical protein
MDVLVKVGRMVGSGKRGLEITQKSVDGAAASNRALVAGTRSGDELEASQPIGNCLARRAQRLLRPLGDCLLSQFQFAETGNSG